MVRYIHTHFKSDFLTHTHSSSMAYLSSSPDASAHHPTPLNTNKNGADRPSPFHPSVWGDYFLSYSEDHKVYIHTFFVWRNDRMMIIYMSCQLP